MNSRRFISHDFKTKSLNQYIGHLVFELNIIVSYDMPPDQTNVSQKPYIIAWKPGSKKEAKTPSKSLLMMNENIISIVTYFQMEIFGLKERMIPIYSLYRQKSEKKLLE